MENQREIFKILNHYHRFCPNHIAVRNNPNLTPAIISGARLFIGKLFFRSWSHAIPPVALRHEHVFVAFWPTILLAGPQSDYLPQFWDGGGNFLDNLRPGKSHNLCGYADLSFTVLFSDKLFADLRSLLENPALSHAEREAEQQRQQQATLESIPDYKGPPADPKMAAEIEALLAEIRGQTKQTAPPEISPEQALAALHQRYRPSLVRSFEIDDSLPEGFYDVPGDGDLYRSFANCWFVQFALTCDDPCIVSDRLVVVSKSSGEIVYDDSASDEE